MAIKRGYWSMDITIIHDFDSALYIRKTCLRRAFWLLFYIIFKNSSWFRSKMPKWLMEEKYSMAKAIALINKEFGINAIFALTEEVEKAFPSLRRELEEMGFKVVEHWHAKEPQPSYDGEKTRGMWPEGIIDPRKVYRLYDRNYSLRGRRELPDRGTVVVWHIDHMPYNVYYYLDFLRRLRDEGDIKLGGH